MNFTHCRVLVLPQTFIEQMDFHFICHFRTVHASLSVELAEWVCKSVVNYWKTASLYVLSI